MRILMDSNLKSTAFLLHVDMNKIFAASVTNTNRTRRDRCVTEIERAIDVKVGKIKPWIMLLSKSLHPLFNSAM
jgi:hypothetical protein